MIKNKWTRSQESHKLLAKYYESQKSDIAQIKSLYHKMIYREQIGGHICSERSKKYIFDFVKRRHYEEKK